jgi:hypothetical protein
MGPSRCLPTRTIVLRRCNACAMPWRAGRLRCMPLRSCAIGCGCCSRLPPAMRSGGRCRPLAAPSRRAFTAGTAAAGRSGRGATDARWLNPEPPCAMSCCSSNSRRSGRTLLPRWATGRGPVQRITWASGATRWSRRHRRTGRWAIPPSNEPRPMVCLPQTCCQKCGPTRLRRPQKRAGPLDQSTSWAGWARTPGDPFSRDPGAGRGVSAGLYLSPNSGRMDRRIHLLGSDTI